MYQSRDETFTIAVMTIVVISTLCQGTIYFGLTVWKLLSYHCAGKHLMPVEISVKFALNLIYFSDRDCEPPIIHLPDENFNVQLTIDYSISEVISERQNAILLFYCTISIFWIITSYFVLIIIVARFPMILVALSIWPWFLVIVAASICDVIATGYHIKDIFYTSTPKAVFEYVGIEYDEIVLKYLATYGDLFSRPAKIFASYSSRCVLFWLLNVFGGIFCIYSATKIIWDHMDQMQYDQQNERWTSLSMF